MTPGADQIDALVAAIPFDRAEALRVVDVFTDRSTVAEAIGRAFPRATVMARQAKLETLDWWDAMFGADLVVIGEGVGALNDPKKQYLYKAAADRVTARGGLLVADAVAPQQILHHLIWLKHAGFAVVDCYWLLHRRAVFGGFSPTNAAGPSNV